MHRRICILVAGSLLAVWSLHAADRPGPSIRLSAAEPRATIDVVGLDPNDLARLARAKLTLDEWKTLLAVRVASASPTDDPDRPAMLGSYRVEAGMLRFEPRFPLSPGVRYQAMFYPARLPGRTDRAAPISAEFLLPRPKSAPAVVEHIYPSRNRLPENHLRFYLHFSTPMSQGNVYRHLRLLNEAGKDIEMPFLELGEELWDREGKRFTLFFDPGRIKRGLKPREEVGPVIEAGKTYTLVVERSWEDGLGNPLRESYRKTFQVIGPDETPIDPKLWKVQPPASPAVPLVVAFPEPLDHALLHRLLWVTDAKGQKVAGVIKVSDEETRWQFMPERPWQGGSYRLIADTALEDLAGNQIGQLFEVDVFKPIPRQVQARTVELPFTVK
jgi:hypothetical protein